MMDVLDDPGVERVVLMTASQVGKTEVINNIVGFFVDQDPAPILVVQPTLEMAEAWSKDRLAPMLRDTPALHGKVSDPKSRDGENRILHKRFPGGHITMAGANSPASLASRPIRLVLCDEVDRYPQSAGAEGDPVRLAFQRARTFWNRRLVMVSSPTVKGVSRIEAAYQASDQREFRVPCPDCDHPQTLRWAQVRWPEGEPEDAVYVCERCAAEWDDNRRRRAVARGRWKATAPFLGTAGFHLNALCSPWITLAEAAREFRAAKSDPLALRTFVNLWLAETFEEEGEGLEPEALQHRREDYTPESLPADVLVLTAGVDVQDDRLEIEVVGWGEGEESWAVDMRQIHGDPSTPAIWADLEDSLTRQFRREDGVTLRLAASCIDSGGHYTQAVYRFVKRRFSRLNRVWATKGVAGAGRPIMGRASKRNVGGVELFPVGVDTAKEAIHAHLARGEPGPGYCHFTQEHDDEYFAQMVAERRERVYKRGFPTTVWRKTRPRNEAFDCRILAYAALVGLNPDWRRVVARDAARVARVSRAQDEPPAAAAPAETTGVTGLPEEPEKTPSFVADRPDKPKPRRARGNWIKRF